MSSEQSRALPEKGLRLGETMKLRMVFVLVAIIVCLSSPLHAQTKPQSVPLPDEILRAEFQPVSGTAPINLSLTKGRVVVLVVWASWCSPCRTALTAVNALSKEYSGRGVEFTGLTIDDPVKDYNDMQKFLERNKIDFKLGWLDNERGKILLMSEAVVPQVLIITRGHAIVQRFLGWNELNTLPKVRKAVDDVLAHPPVTQ
jgi:thiol-disulfide isomerase/thioredoxin